MGTFIGSVGPPSPTKMKHMITSTALFVGILLYLRQEQRRTIR